MTNLEGTHVYGDSWKDLDVSDLKGEATASLWNAETGTAIFPATMYLNIFHVLSSVIRFQNRETRQGQ